MALFLRKDAYNLIIKIGPKQIGFADVDEYHSNMKSHLHSVKGKHLQLHFDVKEMILPSIPVALKFGRVMNSMRSEFERKCTHTHIYGSTKKTQSLFKFVFKIYKPATSVTFH